MSDRLAPVPRLHGLPPSVAGYDCRLSCGHPARTWGRLAPGTWLGCSRCGVSRQSVAAEPAELVICGAVLSLPSRPETARRIGRDWKDRHPDGKDWGYLK